MKNEVEKQILKEDKFSLAYILDYILPGSLFVICLECYKKKELREKLFEYLKEERYYNRLLELNSYKNL